MRKLLLLLVAFVTVSAASAADSIVVKKDARLDVLTAKQAAVNKRNSMLTSTGQYKGYRLQVLSTRDRAKAFEVKAALLTRFPEEKAYLLFQSPYFKIRIGNFIKKEDAEAFRKMLLKLYPEGVYVVADVIDYTPTEEEELFID